MVDVDEGDVVDDVDYVDSSDSVSSVLCVSFASVDMNSAVLEGSSVSDVGGRCTELAPCKSENAHHFKSCLRRSRRSEWVSPSGQIGLVGPRLAGFLAEFWLTTMSSFLELTEIVDTRAS
jgi:hypothetical protein